MRATSTGWVEDDGSVALQTVTSQDLASAATDAYIGCGMDHPHASLRRLPASDKLPCEVTLNFAKPRIVRSVHASSNGRHLELYTLANVAKGSEPARTYLGTARGARREPTMCAYDTTHVMKKPTRCDGIVVRFLSLQGGDKNMARIARIVVRVAEASAASASATAIPSDRRQKDAVREMLMRMSNSGRSVAVPAPDRAAPAVASLPTAGGVPPAAARMMLQQALARAEERMATTMQASVDALEARLNARFDSLDRAVKELRDGASAAAAAAAATATTAPAARAPAPALAPVCVKD